MIRKKNDAIKREFKGVNFDVLAVGKRTMVAKMNYKDSDFVPFHTHPNEQSGYVISGRYRIRFENNDEIIEPGDSYSIPENVEHSIEIIEPGNVIDIYSPIRQDYL